VVGVRVRDHGTIDRAPGVDVEISGRSVRRMQGRLGAAIAAKNLRRGRPRRATRA
jgi:hypothetical protein